MTSVRGELFYAMETDAISPHTTDHMENGGPMVSCGTVLITVGSLFESRQACSQIFFERVCGTPRSGPFKPNPLYKNLIFDPFCGKKIDLLADLDVYHSPWLLG